MKHFALCTLALVGLASATLATDITLTVESAAGESAVTVQPGDPVPYRVRALLSDNLNEGLALIGFDLEFTGGDLTQADAPTSEPMTAFDRPDGLTNPAGYGGTLIGGRLVQVGGGQNTINNGQLACTDNADCPTGSSCTANLCDPVADFPVGMVITGVAEPAPEGLGEAIVVTGTLTAPMAEGDYILRAPIDSIFANVIKEGETGEIFYATEAAGVAASNEFMITVGGDVPASCVNCASLCDDTLAGSAGNIIDLEFDAAITAPAAGDIVIQQLAAGGGFTGGDLSGSFTYSVEPGNILRITADGAVFSHATWYAIQNTGGWTGVANFKVDLQAAVGDANGDGFVTNTDVSIVNADVPCFAACDPRLDINGDGFITNTDVSIANSNIPYFGTPKPDGHACP